jgi:hemolysin III
LNQPGTGNGIREPFSGISHLIGVVLSVVGLITLLILAHGRPWHSLGYAIFGASLIVLYSASTLYHSLHVSERGLVALQRFDHSAIFLLIAGTYAPVCLVVLRSGWGLPLLVAEYGLAAVGIVMVVLYKSKPEWLRVVLYLCMGWLALVALPALWRVMSATAMAWLIAGGLFYTIGVIFYATGRPRLWPGKFGAHDLWHIFVLGGSACHFIFMLFTISVT